MGKKVRGTQKQAPPQVEVNADTVYLRQNITQFSEQNIDGTEMTGWEYDEEQYKKDEFIARIGDLETENAELFFTKMNLEAEVSELWFELMKGAE